MLFVFAWPRTCCLIWNYMTDCLLFIVVYNAATLSEWNVVIYGTKESPDAADSSSPSAVLQQKQQEKPQQQQQITTKKIDDVADANQPPPLISKLMN